MKKLMVLLFACVTLGVCLQAAQLPVDLGSASSFTVLAGSTVTNTGFTTVVGNVGLSPGSSVTGFPPGTITGGALHVNDGAAVSAQGSLSAAYSDAAGRSLAPVTVAGDLSGQTLPPGLYKSTSTLSIGGVLTLDGQSNANSVFIFQIASGLTTGTGSRVVLIGNANPANIFWQVGSSATLGTYSTFNGTILAYASVTLATGAELDGRALAEVGAVTLDSNPMANPGSPVTTAPPPALTVTCPLGTAQVGVAYNSLLAATGGAPPYTFSITPTPASLPPGLTLIPSTGLLIGTPTAAGTSSFVSNVSDSASGTATNSCSINVAAAQANVSIAKSGPATVAPNTNITYNMVVTNTGASLATNVTVTDVVPSGTTFVSATASQGSCSGTSTVTCSLGTLAANGVATVVLVVRSPSTSGTVSNTATVSSTPNTGNNSATWPVTVTTTPSLAVTCPLGAAQLGVGYSSSLVAAGGTPLYTFSITGTLPPGLSLLGAGAITGTPTTAGTYSFTAGVQDSASPTPGTATNGCSITVVAAQADVSINKSGPVPATVGANANIAYTITVTNAGPSPAANVIVGDILPAGTTLVSATPSPAGSSCSGTSTVGCSLGTLAAGGSATIALVVKSPSTSGTVVNTATVATDTLDSNLANNTSTATVTVMAAPSIPALSTWGLALLALLLLLAGCSARFGRKAHS